MRSFRILSALIASIAYVNAEAAPSEDAVLELMAGNFSSIVDSVPLILVEFMAPWCGHCKALMPEYTRAAGVLKEEGIQLAKVDCTGADESVVCASQGVEGYPTLKIFSHGVPSEYKGPRKADGIISYMRKRALPVVSIVSPANHTEFSQSNAVVVIAYLEPSDTGSLEVFTRFAESKRDDYVFGVSYESSSIQDVSSLPSGSLVVWKKFDEGRNDLVGEKLTDDNIAKFIATHSVPLFDELTPANFALYSDAGIPLAYLFIEANNPKRESLVKSLQPIAKQAKGKINFVWIDATKFGDYAKSLNLPGANWPEMVIQNIASQEKFPLDAKKEVNHDNVAEFIRSFQDGKIKPSVKSAPIPSKQGPGSYVLVADAFEEVVYGNDNKKDVFLELYAPWCGHCKRLKPIWDNLARSFEGAGDKVVIAKFDAIENDVPVSSGITIAGYPTLKFKAAGSKEFIDYEGERDLDSMIEFVEKNSVNHVKAVKVEEPEVVEGADSGQVVLDSDESDPVPEEEDKDAEHDEL